MPPPALFVPQPVGLLLAAVLAAHAIGHDRSPSGGDRRPPAVRRREARLFRLGAGLGVLLVCSPLGGYAVDDVLDRTILDCGLAFVVAPLVVLGAPWTRLAAAFRRQLHPAAPDRGGLPVLRPMLGLGLFLGPLWLFHVPAVMDATVGSLALRSLELLFALVGGVLLWAQLLASYPYRPAWQPLGRVALVAATLAGIWLLAVPMVYSSVNWYPALATGPTAVLSAANRQGTAGGVLWGLPTIPLGIATFWCFNEWLGRDDEDTFRLDGLLGRATALPQRTGPFEKQR